MTKLIRLSGVGDGKGEMAPPLGEAEQFAHLHTKRGAHRLHINL